MRKKIEKTLNGMILQFLHGFVSNALGKQNSVDREQYEYTLVCLECNYQANSVGPQEDTSVLVCYKCN